jgi:hypothetical protein
MINFAQNIWHEYGVNFTQRKTISGLALLIYQSNYVSKKKDAFNYGRTVDLIKICKR